VVVSVEGLTKTFVSGFLPYRAVSDLLRRVSPRVADRLSKRVEAVKGLSFEVERGEIFGLLGPNGAGKTTTLKMLMGLIFPDDGRLTVFGRTAGDLEAKKRTGFLPENPYFYEYLKAEEFLGLVASLTGVPAARRRERIDTMLDKVGLGGATDRPLRKFSKGMLQRIGLAQALINDPDLVVLDEPLSGLDPMGRKEIRDIVLDLGRQGKTVLFSSHILSDVEMLCDRVAIMEQGTLRSVAPIEELVTSGQEETEIVLDRSDPRLEEIADLKGVERKRIGSRLHLMIKGNELRDEIVSRAVEAGVSVISVAPAKISLEQVFVAQTAEPRSAGSSGRDEDEMEEDERESEQRPSTEEVSN
jgi:ABC-2 type transport system ATP-binding protein